MNGVAVGESCSGVGVGVVSRGCGCGCVVVCVCGCRCRGGNVRGVILPRILILGGSFTLRITGFWVWLGRVDYLCAHVYVKVCGNWDVRWLHDRGHLRSYILVTV